MLHTHNKVESRAYFYNGLLMTFAFGLFRVVFMSYIIFVLTIGAYKENNYFSGDPDSVRLTMHIVVCFYFVLFGLNCFWLYKMVAGCLKHLNKKPIKQA